MDRVVGHRVTEENRAPAKYDTLTLRPDMAEEDVELGVRVTKVTFRTRYQRCWLPTRITTVYRVTCFAPESIQAELDARLFETQTYPRLCNWFLRNTKYPHLYALHAFLDRLRPMYPSVMKTDAILLP